MSTGNGNFAVLLLLLLLAVHASLASLEEARAPVENPSQYEIFLQKAPDIPEDQRRQHEERITEAERGEMVGGRRGERVLVDTGVKLGLSAPPLSSGPSMAVVNMSFYRWESVAPPPVVDWRKTVAITPIQTQYVDWAVILQDMCHLLSCFRVVVILYLPAAYLANTSAQCSSCWAIAAVDTIAIMWAIANNGVGTNLSPQQVCDCATKQCCQGGWPEWAFSYVLFNGGVTSNANYPYLAYDSATCLLDTSMPSMAQITGWELVPAFNAMALMKAVSMQPVVAFISASAADFTVRLPAPCVTLSAPRCSCFPALIAHTVSQFFAFPRPHRSLFSALPCVSQLTLFSNSPHFPARIVSRLIALPVPVDPRFHVQAYASRDTVNIYNGLCTTEVNHAVVVVGFNYTRPDLKGSYWIIKNSWYTSWGDRGYMYLAMTPDVRGKCGLLSTPAMYPVYFPSGQQPARFASDKRGKWNIKKVDDLSSSLFSSTLSLSSTTTTVTTTTTSGTATIAAVSDPTLSTSSSLLISSDSSAVKTTTLSTTCAGMINPCGGGSCYISGGVPRCDCSVMANMVEMLGVPTSKCVPRSPCTTASVNPCGGGTCSDVGDGTYTCACTTGYAVGAAVDGSPTCAPAAGLAKSYVTNPGDNCTFVATAFGISTTTLTNLNTFINCSVTEYLPPGIALTVSATVTSLSSYCTNTYTVRPSDTCTSVANTFFNGSLTSLMASNPGLSCKRLFKSQQICLLMVTASTTSSAPQCGQSVFVVVGDTCASVAVKYSVESATFASLNPGVNCNINLAVGSYVCVAPTAPSGDTCPSIWNGANLTMSMFLSINPGIQVTSLKFRISPQTRASSPLPPGPAGVLALGLWLSPPLQHGQPLSLSLNCHSFYPFALTCSVPFSSLPLPSPLVQCQAPYLVVGQRVCIDAPLLTTMQRNPNANYSIYTVRAGDTLSNISSLYLPRCTALSVSPAAIAAQNFIADLSAPLAVNTSLIIPCIGGIGMIDAGCAVSLPKCGSDFVIYPSYCDAAANYALPVYDDVSRCYDPCSLACVNRMGLKPLNTTGCTQAICPYPSCCGPALHPPLVSTRAAPPPAALPRNAACCRAALPRTEPRRPAEPRRSAEPRRLAEPRRPTEPRRPAEPRRPTEPRCPPSCTAPAATAASAASAAPAATAATAAMASPTVLTFDAEGRAVDFDVWVDDLQLFLQCDSRDGVSLFDHTSGVSTAPAATADSTVRSQWTTRVAVARLAVRSHPPPTERAHFGQYKTAQSLYDAVVARYSSPATAALSRLMLPYLFPEIATFAIVADLITHLRTGDARYRAALPTEFCAKNPPPPHVHHPLLPSHLPP
ncbi:unnamed protein product [Closterium sp. NIES-53]